MGFTQKIVKHFFSGAIEQIIGQNLAMENMFNFLGKDMPVVTADGFDYIGKGYMQVPAVYECVDLIMKKIQSVPVLTYRVKSVQKQKKYENLLKSDNIADRARAFLMKEEVYEEVAIDGIQRLLERPNDLQNWDDFIGLITILVLTSGNSLVYGNSGTESSKKWGEVWALPFSPNNYNIISGGVMKPVNGYQVNYNAGEYRMSFSAGEIKHVKTINPVFDTQGQWLYGMSPLRPYLMQLIRDKYGNEQANKILYNGANFGYISPKQPIDSPSAEQKQHMKEQIREIIQSKDSVSRYIPSSVPLEWTPIGLGTADMGLLELANASREDIYRGYHVPLTYASNSQSTYNNSNDHKKRLIYDAVVPVMDLIMQHLADFICSPYKEKIILKADYMSLSELSEDMKELTEWLEKAWWLTGNEKRAAQGYSEIDDEDMKKILVNKNMANIMDVAASRTL